MEGLVFFFSFPGGRGKVGFSVRGLPCKEKKKKKTPQERRKKLPPTLALTLAQHSTGTQCTLIGCPTYNRSPPMIGCPFLR